MLTPVTPTEQQNYILNRTMQLHIQNKNTVPTTTYLQSQQNNKITSSTGQCSYISKRKPQLVPTTQHIYSPNRTTQLHLQENNAPAVVTEQWKESQSYLHRFAEMNACRGHRVYWSDIGKIGYFKSGRKILGKNSVPDLFFRGNSTAIQFSAKCRKMTRIVSLQYHRFAVGFNELEDSRYGHSHP
jgi:hypothetical protein